MPLQLKGTTGKIIHQTATTNVELLVLENVMMVSKRLRKDDLILGINKCFLLMSKNTGCIFWVGRPFLQDNPFLRCTYHITNTL